jgi:DNA polymerase iota
MFRGFQQRHDTPAGTEEGYGQHDDGDDVGVGEPKVEAVNLDVEVVGDGGGYSEAGEEGEGDHDTWDHDDADTPEEDLDRCPLCDRLVPAFAMLAHERYHSMEDS